MKNRKFCARYGYMYMGGGGGVGVHPPVGLAGLLDYYHQNDEGGLVSLSQCGKLYLVADNTAT